MTSQEIKIKVARYFLMSLELIDKHSRVRNIVIPRQITHYLCKEYNTGNLTNIGWNVGKKDHATVLNSSNSVKDMIETKYVFMGEPMGDIIDNISQVINLELKLQKKNRTFRQLYDMKRNRYVSEKFLTA